jgi:hypothetical protein
MVDWSAFDRCRVDGLLINVRPDNDVLDITDEVLLRQQGCGRIDIVIRIDQPDESAIVDASDLGFGTGWNRVAGHGLLVGVHRDGTYQSKLADVNSEPP